jgi:Zn-dependent protease
MAILFWGLMTLVIHELGHVVVARVFGVRIKGLVFDRHGLGIRMERGSPLCIFCSALAGPMANVMLAALFWNVPGVWLYNAVLIVLNLLPIPYSDGKRAIGAMRVIYTA